jgi:ribose transport system substrate-binding protein
LNEFGNNQFNIEEGNIYMKKLLIFVSVLAIITMLAACAPAAATKEPVAEQPVATDAPVAVEATTAPVAAAEGTYATMTDGTPQEYAFVAYVTTIPYWNDEMAGCIAGAKLLGATCKLYGPTDLDAQTQAKVVDELIAKGEAGIIISPIDPDVLVGPAQRAMAAGIPVVMAISDVNAARFPGADAASFGWLGGLNKGVGVTGGTYIGEKLCAGIEKCQVGILTMSGVTVHEERKAGYVETLAKYPNVEVVEIADTKADPNIGLQKAAEIIQKYPNLNVLVGTDSVGGAAAARGVQEAGMVGKIKIIGMDRDVDLLNYIKDGVVTASIASKSYTTEFIAVHYLYWIKNGFMDGYLDWKGSGINPIPTITDTGNMLIEQSNVDNFLP